MTVYIEYAFLENFLLDGVLLWLALVATKTPVRWGRLFFSALWGGVFAVIFPLLRLSEFLGGVLKISVGALLPLLSFGRIRTKKDWGRYAFNALFFFALTFAFGGALLGGRGSFSSEKFPQWGVFLGVVFLTAIALFLVEKTYEKKGLHRYIYPCVARFEEKKAAILGFLDSGNMATKNGVPVCFLSADIFYDLCGKEILFESKDGGQVCDEMAIATVTGERKIPLKKGFLEVKFPKNPRNFEVYFALSTNMIGREYKVILNSCIGEEL